ncbi:MAG: hypothetical protein JST36_02685 [Bacteroidetes bacterium]|nr:hypothetical protein [Bacteroidota bacterium]
MIYLLLTIALNVLIFIGFKLFPRFRIDALQAIVCNYWVCVLTGSLFLGDFPISKSSVAQAWAVWALVMGIGFISVFNFIAYCTKKTGITATTIANKLSFVIPVAFAVWLYQDSLGLLKVVGILLSFPAVYFTAKTKSDKQSIGHLGLLLPLFLGSGLLDTLVNYITASYFSSGQAVADARGQATFLTHTFACAALIGSAIVGYRAWRGTMPIRAKNLVAGLLLGIPNYFSMYFFMALLNAGFLPSSAAIPVNNMGILVVATLAAVLMFREEMSRQRTLGMFLSLAAILLILLSGLSN